MKDRNPSHRREAVPLVVLLPITDHRIYREARRILRCLMGRRTPMIESLLLHDLHGRDAAGIADNYLDSIQWPLERGRAVTVRLRQEALRGDAPARRSRRQAPKLAKPPTDPARN